MRPNVKARQIYYFLLNHIRSGPPNRGRKLPPERALAAEFGASRSTVRQALGYLEADGLIRRVRKQGTLIVPRLDRSKPTVSCLLACRDYIGKAGMMWYLIRQMIQDLQAACRDRDFTLELLPVSPSNDPHDIDDSILAHLNAHSRVIVYSDWYLPLLPRLVRTGARTLFIRVRDFRREAVRQEYEASPVNVSYLCPDIEMLYYRAVAYLADLGCRRIACLAPLRYSPHSQIQQGYRKGLAAFTGSQPLLTDWEHLAPALHRFEDVGRFLRDWRKRDRFDGLIYSADMHHFCEEFRIFNRETLGLPESFPVVMAHLVPYQASCNPVFPVIQFERQIPRVAVDLLGAPAEIPKIRILEPKWYPPGSIGT